MTSNDAFSKRLRSILELNGFVFDTPGSFRFPLEERARVAYEAWTEFREEMEKLFTEFEKLVGPLEECEQDT